jgi:hypothetical protein
VIDNRDRLDVKIIFRFLHSTSQHCMVVGTQYYPCRGTTKYLIARLADMGKRLVVRFFAQADPLHVSCEIDHVYKGLGPPAACGSVLDCTSIQNDGNCLKMNGACSLAELTPGSTFPYRDRVSFFQVQVPQLRFFKLRLSPI